MIDSLSIFFPTKNEENSIGKRLEETVMFLRSQKIDYEILIINDGSTDRTEEVVKKFALKHPRVLLLRTNGVKGYAAAIKKGIYSASKKYIFFADADMQFAIQDLKKFLEKGNEYDYILGCRQRLHMSIGKRIYTHVYTFCMNLILGIKVVDANCDFKLFRADVIRSINLQSSTSFINAEIMYKLKKKGYYYLEISVAHHQRKSGQRPLIKSDTFIHVIQDCIRLKFNLF